MSLEITFKSGATVSVDVTEWSFNGLKLTWKTPDQKHRARLVHVDLDEVVAIVEVR